MMYAYSDSTCVNGFVYVCHTCECGPVPIDIDMTTPIPEPYGLSLLRRCTLCQTPHTIHAPLSLINTLKEFLGINLRTSGKDEVLKFRNEWRDMSIEDKKDIQKMLVIAGYRIRR